MPGFFTRDKLKGIAVLSMLCDHVGVALLHGQSELYTPLRILGRIAFPIFAFFIVQGFQYTGSVKKYLMRLGLFALLSEIPFDLAVSGRVLEFRHQNVMFTLFLGLGLLCLLQRWEYSAWRRFGAFVAVCVLGWLLRVDYSWFGVAAIGLFYLLRNQTKWNQFLWMGLLFLSYGGLEAYAVLGVGCALLWQPGQERERLPRYFFYLFYPLHLLALYSLSALGVGVQ